MSPPTPPTRWLEGGAPPGARELLRAGLRTVSIPEAARERAAARVDALSSLPVPAGAAGAAGASGMIATALAGIGGMAVIAVMLSTQSPAPISAPSQPQASGPTLERAAAKQHGVAPSPAAPSSDAPPVPESQARVAAPPISPRRRVPLVVEPPRQAVAAFMAPAPATAEPREDRLAAEVALLEQARALLEQDPRAALERLDAHARDFGHGSLAAEREVLAVDALRRSGRAQAARERAVAFLMRFPDGLQAVRMRRMRDALP